MSFATKTPKGSKQGLGRAGVTTTPIAIRSKVALPRGFETLVRERLATHIGHAATLLERGTVRFEDVNGPRGGADTLCRVKLVLSGRPSLQVEKRATTVDQAFALVLPALATLLSRTSSKHALRAGGRRGRAAPTAKADAVRAPELDGGELIGRRVGRGDDAMKRVLARPEKQRRDAYVDTAAPGTSATARKAGGFSTARRNSRANDDRASAALEDSRTRPSRKSTRKSANRGKPSQGKERAAAMKVVTPSARAARASARRNR